MLPGVQNSATCSLSVNSLSRTDQQINLIGRRSTRKLKTVRFRATQITQRIRCVLMLTNVAIAGGDKPTYRLNTNRTRNPGRLSDAPSSLPVNQPIPDQRQSIIGSDSSADPIFVVEPLGADGFSDNFRFISADRIWREFGVRVEQTKT